MLQQQRVWVGKLAKVNNIIYSNTLDNWKNAHSNQPNNQIQINKASTHYKQPNIAIRETEVDNSYLNIT